MSNELAHGFNPVLIRSLPEVLCFEVKPISSTKDGLHIAACQGFDSLGNMLDPSHAPFVNAKFRWEEADPHTVCHL